MDTWLKESWYIHTIECYSATKMSEVLINAPTWMNLENNMLSERIQVQKVTYYMIPFIRNVQIGKSVEIESSLVDAKGWKSGKWRGAA